MHPDCARVKDYIVQVDDDANRELAERIEKQAQDEDKNIQGLIAKRKRSNKTNHQKVAPQKPSEKYSRFQTARIFLNQMGYFAFDSLKEGNLQYLTKSANLTRDIKGLDRKYS
jgi:hypothetical protein